MDPILCEGRPSPWKVEVPATVTGAKRLRKFFATKEAAEGFIADTTRRVAALGYKAFSEPELPMDGYSVTEVWEKFYREKETDFGPGDYLRDLRMVRKAFCADFGVRKIKGITGAQLNEWLRGLPVSGTTRFNYFKMLRTFFRWAEMYEHCPTDPTRRVAPPKKEEPAKRILTIPEFSRVLAKADAVVRVACVLGGFAGIRTKEILKLRWDDIDFENCEIHVRPGIMKKTRGGASERYVRMEPPLVVWLKWGQAQPVEPKHGGGADDPGGVGDRGPGAPGTALSRIARQGSGRT